MPALSGCASPLSGDVHGPPTLAVDAFHVAAPDADGGKPVLLMTGDQVYADDVAGPMLVAIHALMRRLGRIARDFQARLAQELGDDGPALERALSRLIAAEPESPARN